MFITRYIPRYLSFALALSGFSAYAAAANLDGIFDAGWTTAYQSADSIKHMHKRLHALGIEQVVLQYAAVEKTHLYYPSQLDFLQNTEYKNNQLFPKSIEAAKAAGNKLWLGLYYDDIIWYSSPSNWQLDSLAAQNSKVIDELYTLYGNETVIEGVYIPQEIARYFWDGLRADATAATLATHFLIPVSQAAQAKGWKVMTAPFYNQNLETPEKLQAFFESLFAAGFKPDVVAVQDGIGTENNDKNHADISTVGEYERAVAKACSKYNIDFWVDMELFRTGDSHALADSARFSAQMDTARAAGASKVIAYDLSVLGNAGLDSLEKWFSRNSSLATESFIKFRENRRSSKQRTTGNTPMYTDPRHKEIRYYKLNGAIVKSSE
jgi:hypothetical protein